VSKFMLSRSIELKPLLVSLILVTGSSISFAQPQVLTLNNTVKMAQENDLWLLSNQQSQDSLSSLSVASGSLPDPKVSLGFANVPTDSFDFNQEGMTQFKIGVSQMFPRGDSLNLKRKQLELMANEYPYQRQERKARVVVNVAKLWLDAYKAQESIALIDRDRSLFEQLVDVAESSYATTMGKTSQQDIVRAQLELTQLDDRLTVLNQQRDVALQRLDEWRNNYFIAQASADDLMNSSAHEMGIGNNLSSADLTLDRKLPDIKLLNAELYTSATQTQPQKLYEYLVNHPSVKSVEQKINATNSGIALAKQKYKPEWAVNASYGYRDSNPMGEERADLFSVGISFDVPLFTGNKQDKEVQSAVYKAEALRTKKWLLLRQLMASFETTKAQLLRLDQRRKLYQTQLLPQMHEQAEASLTAYTNVTGDFSEVVRARIAELNANIASLDIEVERQKLRVQLNYFFMKNSNQIIDGRFSERQVENHND
jgi:outer membrane protein TolC